MNTQDKELLLKDLSARLPYGNLVTVRRDRNVLPDILLGVDLEVNKVLTDCGYYDISDISPYLLPLSSMTES